jgi:hypothetical protein
MVHGVGRDAARIAAVVAARESTVIAAVRPALARTRATA